MSPNDPGSDAAQKRRTTTPTPVAPTSGTTNPLAGAQLYVDPYSQAKRQADEWRSSRPSDAAELDKIAKQPMAAWFGSWFSDVGGAANELVTRASAVGVLPVLVLYNIPQRDCGSYSAGGASSADAYKAWIDAISAAIGARKALIVLEPDAISNADCLSITDRSRRFEMLRYAVARLKSQPGTSVYVDAGHPAWQPAAIAASRLIEAGIAQADGFSLNVSNFETTASNLSYGDQISALVGGKHFVIDTSRNGLGPGSTWCNPTGRALGNAPTTSTGHPRVDALLWVKRPGESDGDCNGGPSAGLFWADYALAMAQRTSSAMLASSLGSPGTAN